MNLLGFEQLCRDASVELGVADTGALGQGFAMSYANVLFETAFREGREGFLVLAEVGPVTARDKAAVYESLLTIQLMTWERQRVRFAFDPGRRAVLLCVEVNAQQHLCGEWIAMLVRCIAAQVAEWRKTLLSGAAALA